MPVPWRMTLAWRLLRLVDRAPGFQQPPDRVRGGQRGRAAAGPPARWPGRQSVRRTAHVRPTTSTATLPDGTRLPVRIYRPAAWRLDRRLPLIVNFHGGGFVAGDPRQSEWWCSADRRRRRRRRRLRRLPARAGAPVSRRDGGLLRRDRVGRRARRRTGRRRRAGWR